MRLLFIGDIVGRPGRRAVRELLPGLVEKYAPDAVIANGENAAGGKGISSKVADNLFQLGVSVITMGNHTWGNKEIFALLETERRLVRPLNYPPGLPGQGWLKIETSKGPLVVVNLLGRTGMAGPIDCPFQAMERLLAEVDAPVVVDFHAETTSEKAALAWFLAGRAAAVVGTHTHVQTADCRILPGSTAFITPRDDRASELHFGREDRDYHQQVQDWPARSFEVLHIPSLPAPLWSLSRQGDQN